jgi:hypothetical protein
VASAPEASRAWLLIEDAGPWPHEPVETPLPAALHDLVTAADEFGIRVQMIRRPGRRAPGDASRPERRAGGDASRPERRAGGGPRTVFAGWTAGSEPWLRRASGLVDLDLEKLAAGSAPGFGELVSEPVFLVCTHGRRNVCCARFGGPLAAGLAARYPGQVWETTHVGGHRYAANLVILPHGLYYGPVGVDLAAAAIGAYERGVITPSRYRGRAGQPKAVQEAEYAALSLSGTLSVTP